MQPLFRIVLFVLFAVNANAQYTQLTHFSGTVAYGSYNVTVTPGGSFSTGGGICFAPPTEYWAGPSGPGWYDYVIDKPVYAVKVRTWGINGGPLGFGEYVRMTINGSIYAIQPADVISYTDCMPGGGPMYLWAGDWMGPVGGGYNGGSFAITNCAGITSYRVWCDGSLSGVAYFTFIDTNRGTCFAATNNGPLCMGDTLKLFSHGDSVGATYLWWGPGGYSSTLQNPLFIPGATYADTGVYYVERIIGGIHDTAFTRVIVHPIPELIVTSNSPICQGVGNTLTLFASPDSTGEIFSWTGPNTFTSTLENPTVTGFIPADTGYYVVTATWNGCSKTDSTHVVFAPVPPAPVITGVTLYCTGQPFVPFTVTGTGILWYTTSTGGVGSTTPLTVNTSVAGTTTIWVSQTISGCESPRASITVIVRTTPPPPTISGTTVYCQFFPYIPPTATGTNILWYTIPTGGVGTITVPTVNTNIAGTYVIYASQTDSGCESPRAAFTITVNPKPVPPVIVDIPSNYCPGQPFVPFTIVTGTGVLWYATSTGGVGSPVSPTISTIVPGTYTVWATQTLLGCESDRAAITVTVYDSVTSGFTYDIKYGCKADTVVFHNTSTGASVYLWDFGDRASSIEKDPVHVYKWQSIDTVILLATTGICTIGDTQIINLVHPIKALFTTDTDLICQGNTITFTDASVGTTLSYLWNFGDGITAVGSAIPPHTYPHTGVYKAYEVVTDFVPCHDTLFKTITVDTISPIHMAITDTVLCVGTYITLTGIYSSIGNTGVTWTLGNGDSIKNVNPLVYGFHNPGVYTINAEALYRVCPDTNVSRKVTVLQPPSIDLGSDTTICKGGAAILIKDKINGGNPQASWLWSTGQTSASIIVSEPGDYSATVKVNGCYASGSVKVSNDCYMNIPNVFTPNGDGLNDYFYPRQYLTMGLTSFKLQIYNRWGELIFETTSLTGSGWDGKFNNMDQPVGVYMYVIDGTFKDGQKEHHQGNVTLLR
jgi:gliding motility-associated-like protein